MRDPHLRSRRISSPRAHLNDPIPDLFRHLLQQIGPAVTGESALVLADESHDAVWFGDAQLA
jgi:hypothetical protein